MFQIGDKVKRSYLSEAWFDKCSKFGLDPYAAHKVVDSDLDYDSISLEGMPTHIRWSLGFFVLASGVSLGDML